MTDSKTTGATQDRIVFFDTTLRDGEQSPGCSMCTPEKIEMAHALDDLGVDILEAGFAISSEGDFQAIRAVSQAVRRPAIPWIWQSVPASTPFSPVPICTSK
jgi:2-isopropylmalate synthase